MGKTTTLIEFLTNDQIERCLVLYPDHNAILKEVIAPNINDINRKLGQENDERFLAYLIVAAISEAARLKGAS
jgi:hypothetical protein